VGERVTLIARHVDGGVAFGPSRVARLLGASGQSGRSFQPVLVTGTVDAFSRRTRSACAGRTLTGQRRPVLDREERRLSGLRRQTIKPPSRAWKRHLPFNIGRDTHFCQPGLAFDLRRRRTDLA